MKLKRHHNFDVNEDNPYKDRTADTDHMSLSDLTETVVTFYDDIKKYAPFMQEDTVAHLKEAFKHLDKAWAAESESHGEDFTPYGNVFAGAGEKASPYDEKNW